MSLGLCYVLSGMLGWVGTPGRGGSRVPSPKRLTSRRREVPGNLAVGMGRATLAPAPLAPWGAWPSCSWAGVAVRM